jgi:hypothetical protein
MGSIYLTHIVSMLVSISSLSWILTKLEEQRVDLGIDPLLPIRAPTLGGGSELTLRDFVTLRDISARKFRPGRAPRCLHDSVCRPACDSVCRPRFCVSARKPWCLKNHGGAKACAVDAHDSVCRPRRWGGVGGAQSGAERQGAARKG